MVGLFSLFGNYVGGNIGSLIFLPQVDTIPRTSSLGRTFADFNSAIYEYNYETDKKKLQGISNRNFIVTYQLHNKPKKVVAG